jgi:photosystem II S4 domain protein
MSLSRAELLQGVEYRDTLARILDLTDQTLKTWQVTCSDFLSPPEVSEATRCLRRLSEIEFCVWGGYPQAERQRLAIGRTALEHSHVPLGALSVRGNFLFDPATHRDFLGSLLGSGIERDKVGDILVLGDQGAQVIVVPELAEFLSTEWTQVRSVPVKVESIALTDLKVRPPQIKSMTTVEASLRLDAVGSAGFSMSRTKMVAEIERGEVKVNWKTVSQPSYTLSPKDLITLRGKGRLQVEDITETKKGRYRIELTRYV